MSVRLSWLRRGFVLAAGLSVASLSSGCGIVKCGDGTLESDGTCVAAPGAQQPAINVKVSSLTVDHDGTTPLFVNHPIRVKVGFTSQGKKSLVAVSVALVSKTLGGKGCYLGGGDAVLAGTGDEQVFDYEFLVPKICDAADYNLAVGFDSTGGAPALKDNFVTFSPDNMAKPENASCKGLTLAGDSTACSYGLKIVSSPGTDYTMAQLEPLSSVGVLYVEPPAGQDAIPGKPETPTPFMRANWTVTTLGRDIDEEGSEKRPLPLNIRYYVRAIKDAANVGWRLLNFGPEPDPKDATKLINPTVRTVAEFRPGLRYQNSNNLYMVDEFDRIISGSWKTEEDFLIKGCLETDYQEVGDPVYANVDGKGNNCVTFPVRIVRALPPVKAASSQAFNMDWAKDFGNESTFKFSAALTSTNMLDFNGAHLDESVNSVIVSKLLGQNLTLIKARANAEALVALVGSHIDAQVDVYNFTLFTYSKQIKDSFSWTMPTWSVAKSLPISFKYYAIPLVNLDVTFEAAGNASLDANVALTAKSGAGVAPFNTAQKIGSIDGSVNPRGKITAKFSAKAAALGFTAAAAGDLLLVEVAAPLKSQLAWGLTSVNPARLTVVGTVNWHIDVGSIGGKVDLSVSTPKIPFIGVKTGTWNLVQLEPSTKGYDLLNRQATVTLGN